jgi:hypothetical protein
VRLRRHAGRGVVGDEDKAGFGPVVFERAAIGERQHEQRVMVLAVDMSGLLVALLAGPFVPALGRHDRAAGLHQAAPITIGKLFQPRINTDRSSGR